MKISILIYASLESPRQIIQYITLRRDVYARFTQKMNFELHTPLGNNFAWNNPMETLSVVYIVLYIRITTADVANDFQTDINYKRKTPNACVLTNYFKTCWGNFSKRNKNVVIFETIIYRRVSVVLRQIAGFPIPSRQRGRKNTRRNITRSN